MRLALFERLDFFVRRQRTKPSGVPHERSHTPAAEVRDGGDDGVPLRLGLGELHEVIQLGIWNIDRRFRDSKLRLYEFWSKVKWNLSTRFFDLGSSPR